MHLLTNSVSISFGLTPGNWIVEDADAGIIMAKSPGGSCRLRHWSSHDSLEGVTNPTRILIIRPGRFGDLILLTPVLRTIKAKFPSAILALAVLPIYRDAVIGLPYIDEFLSYPVKQDTLGTSIVLTLETTLEYSADEKTKHITDIFAERLGVEVKDKKPDFYLTADETSWAENNYARKSDRRIAVQLASSSAARDYPPPSMIEVLRQLREAKWDILILGAPDEFQMKMPPGIRNCTTDRLSFRQSAAVLSTADVFLGPDSSLIHVAGALGLPALGLFAVVPWQLRTNYCPTTFVLQGKEGCDIAPCFSAFNGADAKGFPSIGPCAKTGRCEALASISPDRVVAKLESML